MMTLASHRKLRAPARQPARRESLHDQRGQSAVEITLLLPLLLVLLLGIILSGFTFYAFIQVSNAAREGTRAGTMYRITQATSGFDLPTTVKDAICNSNTSALGYLKPTSSCSSSAFSVASDVACTLNGVVCSSTSNPQPGDQLTVQITYRYTVPLVSDLLPMFPQPIVIVRSVMMEIQ